MTIPVLTVLVSEPARSAVPPAKPRSEPRADTAPARKDDRDFAATMSDGARDARNEPARRKDTAEAHDRPDRTAPDQTGPDRNGTAPARKADTASDGADRAEGADGTSDGADRAEDADGTSGEDTTVMAADAAPRRQVTIPELPARRTATADPELRAPEAAPAPQALPAAEGEPLSLQPLPSDTGVARTDQSATAAEPLVRAAPRAATGQAVASGAVTPPTTATAPANAPDAAAEPQDFAPLKAQAGYAPARDDPGATSAPAQPATRVAAAGHPAAQAMRPGELARAPARTPSEDRASARARDSAARAVETVAQAPAQAPQVSAAQTSVATQTGILQPASREAMAASDKSDTVLSLDGEAESLRFDMRGTSGTHGTQHGSFASAVARADLPRGVAMQIGDAVRAMPDRPVDVSLSPEELGRVRLSISTNDGGVTLHVLAERPETLDLMRRHADQLARELADLGFTSIDLSFGKGRDPESRDGDGSSGEVNHRPSRTGNDTDIASPVEGPVTRMTLSPSGGLDIRI